MGVFEFILAIVLIGVGGGIIRDRMKYKHGKTGPGHSAAKGNGAGYGADDFGMGFGSGMGCPLCDGLVSDGDTSDDIREKLERLGKLEERVQVLERIVTDRRVHLAEEIDRL